MQCLAFIYITLDHVHAPKSKRSTSMCLASKQSNVIALNPNWEALADGVYVQMNENEFTKQVFLFFCSSNNSAELPFFPRYFTKPAHVCLLCN